MKLGLTQRSRGAPGKKSPTKQITKRFGKGLQKWPQVNPPHPALVGILQPKFGGGKIKAHSYQPDCSSAGFQSAAPRPGTEPPRQHLFPSRLVVLEKTSAQEAHTRTPLFPCLLNRLSHVVAGGVSLSQKVPPSPLWREQSTQISASLANLSLRCSLFTVSHAGCLSFWGLPSIPGCSTLVFRGVGVVFCLGQAEFEQNAARKINMKKHVQAIWLDM